jgi:hypothetical protein
MIGTIYKISSGLTNKIYIGSTTLSVAQRFSQHKSRFNKKILNCTSKVLFDFGDVTVTELACCKFNNKQELRDIEYSIMKQYGDLCVNINGTKDCRSSDYRKQYRALHPLSVVNDNLKRPQTRHCETCNKEVAYAHFSRHTKTKKHLDKVL